jgi:hypothetical protein
VSSESAKHPQRVTFLRQTQTGDPTPTKTWAGVCSRRAESSERARREVLIIRTQPVDHRDDGALTVSTEYSGIRDGGSEDCRRAGVAQEQRKASREGAEKRNIQEWLAQG